MADVRFYKKPFFDVQEINFLGIFVILGQFGGIVTSITLPLGILILIISDFYFTRHLHKIQSTNDDRIP